MTDKMKILIAYDGSDCADAALTNLQRAGLPSEAEAIVLSVDEQWLPVPTSYWMMRTSHASTHPVSDEVREMAERAAQCVRDLFPAWEVRAEAQSGSPASVILAGAREWAPRSACRWLAWTHRCSEVLSRQHLAKNALSSSLLRACGAWPRPSGGCADQNHRWHGRLGGRGRGRPRCGQTHLARRNRGPAALCLAAPPCRHKQPDQQLCLGMAEDGACQSADKRRKSGV